MSKSMSGVLSLVVSATVALAGVACSGGGGPAGNGSGGSGGSGGAGGGGGGGGGGAGGSTDGGAPDASDAPAGDAPADGSASDGPTDTFVFDAPRDAPPIPGMALATFDTTTEGFVFSQTDMAGNLAVHNAGTAPALAWVQDEGNPLPGALRVTAPYSAYRQYVDVTKLFATPQSWAGKTRLRVRFRVASGFNPDPSFPGLALVYAQSLVAGSDAGAAADSRFLRLSEGIARTTEWQEISINVTSVSVGGWDPTRVVAVGLQLLTGSGGGTTGGGDGGADAGGASDGPPPPTGNPTPAVVFLDSFSFE